MQSNDSFRAAIKDLSERLSKKSDTAESKAVSNAASQLNSGYQALLKMQSTPKSTETQAKHYQKVAQAAKTLMKRAEEASSRIQNHQRKALGNIEQQISERLGLTESTYANEIRSTLRSADRKERARLLQEIVESGDGPAMAAITSAPAMLTGITEAEKNLYQETFVSRHAADLINQRDDLLEAVSTGAALVGTIKKAAGSMFDEQTLTDIENSEREADAASSRFAESFKEE